MTVKTRGWLRVLVLMAAALLPRAVLAIDQDASSTLAVSGEQTMDLEEVEVIGKKLYQLKKELMATQDHFFALYNEFNTNDDFDIHCTLHAPVGTRIEQRQCRLESLIEAPAQEGQNFFLGLNSDPPQPARPSVSPHTLWYQRADEDRRTMKAVLEAHPVLIEVAGEWRQKQARLEKARKDRLNGRLVLFE